MAFALEGLPILETAIGSSGIDFGFGTNFTASLEEILSQPSVTRFGFDSTTYAQLNPSSNVLDDVLNLPTSFEQGGETPNAVSFSDDQSSNANGFDLNNVLANINNYLSPSSANSITTSGALFQLAGSNTQATYEQQSGGVGNTRQAEVDRSNAASTFQSTIGGGMLGGLGGPIGTIAGAVLGNAFAPTTQAQINTTGGDATNSNIINYG